MDIFAQKKLLVRLVIILTVLNIFSVGIFLYKEFHHKPNTCLQDKDKPKASDILDNELNLSISQKDQIENLRTNYMKKEEVFETIIRSKRDSMNMLMFSKDNNEELVKTLARDVAEYEYKMEMLRFKQANELKKICNPQQLEKFAGLVLEIRDFFKPCDKQMRRK